MGIFCCYAFWVKQQALLSRERGIKGLYDAIILDQFKTLQ